MFPEGVVAAWEVGEVVVDQPHRLSLRKGVLEPLVGGWWESRWRRVFPVGFDAWSSPERAGGVNVGVWPSFLQGPVPVSEHVPVQ